MDPDTESTAQCGACVEDAPPVKKRVRKQCSEEGCNNAAQKQGRCETCHTKATGEKRKQCSEDGMSGGGPDDACPDEETVRTDPSVAKASIMALRATPLESAIYDACPADNRHDPKRAWITQEHAEMLLRKIYGIRELTSAVFRIDGDLRRFVRVSAADEFCKKLNQLQNESGTAVLLAHPYISNHAPYYHLRVNDKKRVNGKTFPVARCFYWGAGFSDKESSCNETILHKRAKNFLFTYPGKTHLFTKCDHPCHGKWGVCERVPTGCDIEHAVRHMVFGRGRRHEETRFGDLTYDVTDHHLVRDHIMASLEVEVTHSNSDDKRELHTSPGSPFPLGQVTGQQVMCEADRVRGLETRLVNAQTELWESEGEKGGLDVDKRRELKEMQREFDEDSDLYMYHNPRGRAGHEFCHVCSEKNERLEAERREAARVEAENEARDIKYAIEDESDCQILEEECEAERIRLEAPIMADWSKINATEYSSQDGKFVHGVFTCGDGCGPYVLCRLGFMKIVVSQALVPDLRRLHGSTIYFQLKTVVSTVDRSDLIQRPHRLAPFHRESPVHDELLAFRKEREGQARARRAAERCPPVGSSGR